MEKELRKVYNSSKVELFPGIRAEVLEIGTYWGDMKSTDKSSKDYLKLIVGDNDGNCIYTSAKGGNLIYKSIKNKTLDLSKFSPRIKLGNSFEAVNIIREFLKSNNIEYYIGPSQHQIYD